MASTIARTPLIRIAATRSYAQIAPVSGNPNYEVKTSILPNKLIVAAVDNDSAVTRISIVLRAGSRNESPENLGVTHVLRTCAGLSTKNASQFAIMRNIQQVGAKLTAISDRETISYTLEGTRRAVDKALPFLTEVATQQVFKPWEVSDNSNRLLIDIATRPLQVRAIDLLHSAAYRTGLGNSLFIPKNQIGKISSESLQHYVANNFLTARAAVVGLGVSQTDLAEYAQCIKLGTGEGCTPASPYKGGELRSNKGGNLAFVAIAGEGADLKSKEAIVFAVLQRTVGVGSQIKWSTQDNGLLHKSMGTTCVEGFASTAINVSYSDSGLFGVLLAVPSKAARKVVESAVNMFKNSTVTDEDVARGKNLLKSAILLDGESGSRALHSFGTQAAVIRQIQTPCQLAATVDSVTTSDVVNALKKVGKKLSIASVGNLYEVPYLDELK